MGCTVRLSFSLLRTNDEKITESSESRTVEDYQAMRNNPAARDALQEALGLSATTCQRNFPQCFEPK